MLVWTRGDAAPESHPESPALLLTLPRWASRALVQRDETGRGERVKYATGLVLGFASGIILFNAMTGWCMGDDRMVYVVKHNACVSERTFVPAGYVPVEK